MVCRSCGAEVSPYVTECPYCGTRIRKRAPKLERHGDELTAKESRRTRRARRRRELAVERAGRALASAERPYATLVAILAPAVLYVLVRADVVSALDAGAIAGDPGPDAWRYAAAPWVYDSAGYLFVVGVALALFASGLERRLGAPAVGILLVACGSLGMLAAGAVDDALGESLVAAGGNGVALGALGAWAVLRRAEVAGTGGDDTDWIGIATIAAVLLVLPVADDLASPVAGAVGGIVGSAAGLAASRAQR